jgi:hypothetical protein
MGSDPKAVQALEPLVQSMVAWPYMVRTTRLMVPPPTRSRYGPHASPFSMGCC